MTNDGFFQLASLSKEKRLKLEYRKRYYALRKALKEIREICEQALDPEDDGIPAEDFYAISEIIKSVMK